MRKLWPALLLCLLLFTACEKPRQFDTYTVPTLDPSGGDKTFTTYDYGLSFRYPHTWANFENTGALAQILSPPADKTPDFREYITAGVMPNTENLSAQEVANQTTEGLKEFYTGLAVQEEGSRTVAGREMAFRAYTGKAKEGEADIYIEQLTFLSGQDSYTLTLVTDISLKEEYLPVFAYVQASLRIDLP